MVRQFTSRYIPRTPTVVARTRRIIAAIYRDWPAKRGGKERTFDSGRSRKGETRERKALRSSRPSRVPAEPAVGAPRVRIAVHHVASGKIVRYFSSSDKMLSVYDWIGLLVKEPENFKLCFSPKVVAMPSDPVSNCTLYMQVTDESILLLEDSDVTFKGYSGSEQRYVLTGMLL